MMTTFAAILGAVPLAIGWGEGAELRQPLGVTIIGGLLVSQVLTLLTTPVVYLYLDRFRRRDAAPPTGPRPGGAPGPRRIRVMTPHAPIASVSASLPLLLAASALSACEVGPELSAARARRRRRPTRRSQGWTPAQPSDAADRADWWTVFNDPVLNDLEAEGRGLQPEPGRRRGGLPAGPRAGRRAARGALPTRHRHRLGQRLQGRRRRQP